MLSRVVHRRGPLRQPQTRRPCKINSGARVHSRRYTTDSAAVQTAVVDDPVIFTEKRFSSEEFIAGRRHVGTITLNRPKALNALNTQMAKEIFEKVLSWEADPNFGMFEMVGVGGKAFCAGGDIRSLYDAVTSDPASGRAKAAEFFKQEYQMNWLLGNTSLTQVSYLDGITMGGGVGLSVHGKVRVVTEKTVFAMPETAIGFFPDVGGSYFLPRINNHWGYYLALTGRQIKGVDTMYVGVGTHYIRSKYLELAREQLKEAGPRNVNQVRDFFMDAMKKTLKGMPNEEPNATFIFEKHGEAISRVFSKPSVKEILEELKTIPDQWAKEARETMLEKVSPMSVMVTFELLNRGKKLKSLAECLEMEYAVAQHFMHESDFFEGVRALLVDKDKNPRWKPKNLDEITSEDVAVYFDMETHRGKYNLDRLVLSDVYLYPVWLVRSDIVQTAVSATLKGVMSIATKTRDKIKNFSVQSAIDKTAELGQKAQSTFSGLRGAWKRTRSTAEVRKRLAKEK